MPSKQSVWLLERKLLDEDGKPVYFKHAFQDGNGYELTADPFAAMSFPTRKHARETLSNELSSDEAKRFRPQQHILTPHGTKRPWWRMVLLAATPRGWRLIGNLFRAVKAVKSKVPE